jgi:hypothetical protein
MPSARAADLSEIAHIALWLALRPAARLAAC